MITKSMRFYEGLQCRKGRWILPSIAVILGLIVLIVHVYNVSLQGHEPIKNCCLDAYSKVWKYERDIQSIYNISLVCHTFIPSDCNCSNVGFACQQK